MNYKKTGLHLHSIALTNPLVGKEALILHSK